MSLAGLHNFKYWYVHYNVGCMYTNELALIRDPPTPRKFISSSLGVIFFEFG